MTNAITSTGLSVNTLATTTANIVAALQGIYGTGIQTDQNSPDGQAIGISAQAVTDMLELIVSVNNSFDPDQAFGTVLDQRLAINNVKRQGGTYTVQPIDVTVSGTVTLAGLDGNYASPTATAYTIQDSSGNQFILAATTTFTAGLTSADFRAQQVGNVTVPINTITVPVTVVPGVTSVNNSSAQISIGQNQETDPQARTRRQQSVANATSGNSQGLQGKLLALTGVTEASVFQNRTNATDANGIPAHNMWIVVAGGSNAAIAQTIYQTISDGAPMKGRVTYSYLTPNGSYFPAAWDVPAPESLYIKFTIKTTVPGFDFSTSAIQAYIAANLTYGIGQFAETSSITAIALMAILAQGGGGVPVLVQISTDDSSWTDYCTTTTLASEFTVAGANITIAVV